MTQEELNEQLINAARDGDTVKAEELLNAGAEVNSVNYMGGTPLMRACTYGRMDMVRFLLRKGADPNIRDKNGGTALIWASINGHIEVMKLLVDSYADIGTRNEKGLTALDILKTRYPEQYKKLLQNEIKKTRKRILKKEDSTENLKNVPDFDI